MKRPPFKIKIVGIGGAGINSINRLKNFGLKVESIAIDTDVSCLNSCSAEKKVLLGENIFSGLSSGGNINLTAKAANEAKENIKEAIKGSDLIFLVLNLGGGVAAGVSPLIAEIAGELKILTIAFLTKPFSFEGFFRQKIANLGLHRLKRKVDGFVLIENDKLPRIIAKNTSVEDALLLSDKVLFEAIFGIFNISTLKSILAIDLSDLFEFFKNSGEILFSQVKVAGENWLVDGVNQAINSSLVDFKINKAKKILFNITSKQDLSLAEVENAINFVKNLVPKGTKIIFGASEDNSLSKGEVKITLIATGGHGK